MGSVAQAEMSVASGLVVTFIAVQPMLQAGLLSFFKIVPRPIECFGIFIGLIGVIMLMGGLVLLGVLFGQEITSQWEWLSAVVIVLGVFLIVLASLSQQACQSARSNTAGHRIGTAGQNDRHRRS